MGVLQLYSLIKPSAGASVCHMPGMVQAGCQRSWHGARVQNDRNTVEQVKFACAIISRIRKLVSHSRT